MSSPRHDIYAFIHKGLRAFMSHALVRVGRLDADDAAEVAEAGAELRALVAICRSHLDKENTVIHPALAARAPGSLARVEREHAQHGAALDELEALIGRIGGDPAAARQLYRALTRFVAENFEHMEAEETELNAALWATHSDAEILALEQRIVAGLTPEASQLAMRWMLPHMTPAERAAFLGGLRRHAPAAAFDGLLSLIRPLLGGRDWRKLASALSL